MTVAAPVARRWRPARPHQSLEAPQVLLLTLVLVVLDVVVLIGINVMVAGIGCTSTRCTIERAGSIGRPVIAVVLAAVTILVPIGLATWAWRGIRTVTFVQLIGGGLLLVHALSLVSSAQAFREHPTPLPTEVHYVPCVEITLHGQTCVTQPPQTGGSP